MGRRITISDIAKRTGLSLSTVSKAFTRSTDISEETKAGVLKCASELGYIPKSAMKSGRIAVIIDNNDHLDSNHTDYQIFYGFELTAAQLGYTLDIINKNTLSPEKVDMLQNEYAGIFLARINVNGGEECIKRIRLPTVSFGQHIDNDNITYVGCDYQASLTYVIRHLKELGHEKIAFFSGDHTSLLNRYKKNEFITALRILGLGVYPELIFESDNKIDFAAQYISKLLLENATAVVCASDLLASHMINALREADIPVPQRMSVVGFGDVPLSETTQPRLTTVSPNGIELGRCICYALYGRLNGLCVARVLCRPMLIVRESTGSLPAAKIVR